MRSPLAFLVVALSFAAAPAGLLAAPEDPTVLARVDGDPITLQDLDLLLANQPETADPAEIDAAGALRRLIQNRLLEHEGYRIAADERPEVVSQVRDLRGYRGMMTLLDSIRTSVPDPDPAELSGTLDRTSTMIRVSHILVGSESFAKILLDSLQAGVPFAELASRRSLDTARAEVGGDLGWGRAEMYIPEFRGVLEGLSVGGIAGPVETEEGWHLLTVTDTRTETAGQSEEMRDQLVEALKRERVMGAVKSFVATLYDKYGVVVNDSLVATLDYGSTDSGVQTALHESEDVVASLPFGDLRVKDLTRRLRFEHFHGVEGKENSNEIRDEVLDDYLTELLLRYEAGQRGYNDRPAVVTAAEQLKRQLVREIVVQNVLAFPFHPDPEQVRRYYDEHSSRFTPEARLRAEGVVLADMESATRFREKLEEGAKLRWLVERTPEVQDANPTLFNDWIEPEELGLEKGEASKGAIIGPLPLEEGWGIAQVTQVESPAPLPLERCHDEVVAMMQRERSREEMNRALETLEKEAEIDVPDDAEDLVAIRIDEWRGTSTTPEMPPDSRAGEEAGS